MANFIFNASLPLICRRTSTLTKNAFPGSDRRLGDGHADEKTLLYSCEDASRKKKTKKKTKKKRRKKKKTKKKKKKTIKKKKKSYPSHPDGILQGRDGDGGGGIVKRRRRRRKIRRGAGVQQKRGQKMRMRFLQGRTEVMEGTDSFAREKLHEFRDPDRKEGRNT